MAVKGGLIEREKWSVHAENTIDGTHIFDKFKILSMELNNDRLTIHMKDKDVILTVVAK